MEFVPAQCPRCNGILKVDPSLEAAVCEYCNMPYVVEKAINNYNTVNNITADVVNVYGNMDADFVIRAGELIKYNGASVDVVIPNNVIKISGVEGEYAMIGAFQNRLIKSVVIPESVVIIGESAFNGCEYLSNLNIPKSVNKIERSAFSGCKNLKKVNIPNGITEISDGLFQGCESLESIVIPESVTYIGNSAFSDCKNIINIDIPKSVRIIERFAFSGCKNLRKVTIPNGITEISDGLFQDCENLESVVIPESVTKIGNAAFSDCKNIMNIDIHNSISQIGYGAFVNCANLISINIPKNITKIENGTFNGCSSLKNIAIPNNVTEIGHSAFLKCSSLKEIVIPRNVKVIREQAFLNTALKYITMYSTTRIENRSVLEYCPIEKITILGGDPFYDTNPFNLWHIPTTAEVHTPKKIYKYKKGCYIATAVYGSYNAPQVMVLRRYRDNVLDKSFLGKLFIKAYYQVSPPLAKRLKNMKRLNALVRVILDRVVKKLS